MQNRLNADFLGRPLHRPEGVALEANGFMKGVIQKGMHNSNIENQE